MSSTKHIDESDTTEVIRLINQWSGKGFFRVNRLGDLMDLLEVRARSAHVVRVRTQYEDRSMAVSAVPYRGGEADGPQRVAHSDVGPDLWGVATHRPTDFEDGSETMPLPHPRKSPRTRRACAPPSAKA